MMLGNDEELQQDNAERWNQEMFNDWFRRGGGRRIPVRNGDAPAGGEVVSTTPPYGGPKNPGSVGWDNTGAPTRRYVAPQPPSKQNDEPAIWDLVLDTFRARDRMGLEKYKTRLQAFNGRCALLDILGEKLDEIAYTMQMIEEQRWLGRKIRDLRGLLFDGKTDAAYALVGEITDRVKFPE
jgi:hypothetical protein